MQVPHSGVAREPLAVWPYAVFPYVVRVVPPECRNLLRTIPPAAHEYDHGIPGAPGTVLHAIAVFLIEESRESMTYPQIIVGAGLASRNAKQAIWWLHDHHMLLRSGPKGRMQYTRAGQLLRAWKKAKNERRKAKAP